MSGTADLAEFHDELRLVARDLLGKSTDESTAWRDVVGAGWPGLEVDESLGGSGATFAETAVVLEEMGRAAAVGPFLGTAVLGVGALRSLERHDARDALLGDVAAGRTRLAVALARGADQLDAEPPFRVRRDDASARLDGGAELVVDAATAHRLLLLAHDEDDRPVLVSIDPAAAEVRDQPVLDATRRFGSVVARGVAVDESSIWSFEGDAATASRQLVDRAALAVACDSLGVAAAMLDATVAYVGVRRQFDRPIGSFQAVKHACADMFVGLAVARELLVLAVDAVARSDGEPAGAAVSRAKSNVCAMAVEVVGEAMQLHGGIGYTWESGIHTYLKRAVLNRALFGSPAAHRKRLGAVIARVEK